ncbi:MAG: hypothetical protein ABGX07_17680 [Pirellulaceae bacterium]
MWQSIYEDINDENFVIMSAAQDTGGEAAAGKIFDDAKVTYTAIIDEDHTISSLFNLVNVPSGVWIDEQGQIVRLNEGTYSKHHKLGTFEFGSDIYVPALRDWIAKGSDSEFAWSPEEVSANLIPRTPAGERAEPAFKLGVYFHSQGRESQANYWWEESQRLNPDSWNFHRQDWSFTPSEASSNFMRKVQGLGDKPYYKPMDLPGE